MSLFVKHILKKGEGNEEFCLCMDGFSVTDTTSIVFSWPVKSIVIENLMTSISKQTAVWNEFMAATKAALELEEVYPEEVSQFFVGNVAIFFTSMNFLWRC